MIVLCTLGHNKLELSYVVNNIELYIGISSTNMPIGDNKTFIGDRYSVFGLCNVIIISDSIIR